MIQEFVDKFMAAKPTLRAQFAESPPDNYKDLVTRVITLFHEPDSFTDSPNPARIHEIDDGDYQGTLLYLIAATGYQPDEYWFVRVSYGSCSGCDTLQAISGSVATYDDAGDKLSPTDEQLDQYMQLALHIVQRLQKLPS